MSRGARRRLPRAPAAGSRSAGRLRGWGANDGFVGLEQLRAHVGDREVVRGVARALPDRRAAETWRSCGHEPGCPHIRPDAFASGLDADSAASSLPVSLSSVYQSGCSPLEIAGAAGRMRAGPKRVAHCSRAGADRSSTSWSRPGDHLEDAAPSARARAAASSTSARPAPRRMWAGSTNSSSSACTAPSLQITTVKPIGAWSPARTPYPAVVDEGVRRAIASGLAASGARSLPDVRGSALQCLVRVALRAVASRMLTGRITA